MWRLYVAKGTSPVEIEREWSLRMVLDANDALDLQDEATRRSIEDARSKAKAETAKP